MSSGVLNVIKPAGSTSFAVVRRLRQLTGGRRVGHAGTLDPLATGVLPVLVGSATRLADFAHLLPKTYVADVHLGFRTSTDDAEGELQAVGSTGGLTAAAVASALAGFVGHIRQQPPAFSAVKIAGERSYQRARQGDLSLPAAREVVVHSAELLEFIAGERATARIRVVCGSGTYLRALARDLGSELGVGGYLGRLVRTAYGPLLIEDADPLDRLSDPSAVEARLQPAEVLLPPAMTRVRLTVEQEAQVRQGRAVRVLPEPPAGPVRAHGEDGDLIALGHTDPLRHTFVPEKVFS